MEGQPHGEGGEEGCVALASMVGSKDSGEGWGWMGDGGGRSWSWSWQLPVRGTCRYKTEAGTRPSLVIVPLPSLPLLKQLLVVHSPLFP